MRLVTLWRFATGWEAGLGKGLLEEPGIRTSYAGGTDTPVSGGGALPMGVRLAASRASATWPGTMAFKASQGRLPAPVVLGPQSQKRNQETFSTKNVPTFFSPRV